MPQRGRFSYHVRQALFRFKLLSSKIRNMSKQSPHRKHWQLNPEVAFLNHGSFGATPTVVLRAQREFQDAMELDPIQFLAPERELEPKLDRVRELLASLFGADAQDIAFVRNVTDGVSAVLRSFPFDTGDEIVITDHGYNACNNAAQFAADRAGAIIRKARLPYPVHDPDQVVAAIQRQFTDRTRLLLVDHVTSPTGLVLPLQQIVTAAKSRGIQVMVDGAHAPGMLPLDLKSIDADYYTANHHKWLCGPKVSGFLWVHPERQQQVRPTIISHAANRERPGRSKFLAEFDWMGTFDPTPVLALESAINFLSNLMPGGLPQLMESNRNLALQARDVLTQTLGIEPPAPAAMIANLVALPLPTNADINVIRQQMLSKYRIEAPLFIGPSDAGPMIRTSSQAYNHISEFERLADALPTILQSATSS